MELGFKGTTPMITDLSNFILILKICKISKQICSRTLYQGLCVMPLQECMDSKGFLMQRAMFASTGNVSFLT